MIQTDGVFHNFCFLLGSYKIIFVISLLLIDILGSHVSVISRSPKTTSCHLLSTWEVRYPMKCESNLENMSKKRYLFLIPLVTFDQTPHCWLDRMFFAIKDSVKSGVFYRYLSFTLSVDYWEKQSALLGGMVPAMHSFTVFRNVACQKWLG